MRGIDGIHTERVPSVNGVNSFSLDQYEHRDNSRAKRKASAWGNGDFASVIRQNMDKFCDDYKTDVPKSVVFPMKHTEGKPIERPRRERSSAAEHLPRRTGYHKRRMELSEIGIRIDSLLRKNNTNIHKLSVAIKKKEHTIALAMQPNALTKRTTYEAIANYFGVSADYLINGEDKNG